MKTPYGVSNFKKVREQGFVYIDKTEHIATLENQGSYSGPHKRDSQLR